MGYNCISKSSTFLCIKIGRYHVPRSWLKPTKNLMVVFEELGGNPWKISIVKRAVHTPRHGIKSDSEN